MNLSENLTKQLKALARGYHGRALKAYSEELIKELGDITTVTSEQLEGRKQAVEAIREHYIAFFDRLQQDHPHQEDNYE